MTPRHHIENRRIFFDVETNGLNPSRHNIIQIAAVAADDEGVILDTFEVKLLFEEQDADPEALRKVSYDKELWAKHGVDPLTAYERFVWFAREHATVRRVSRRTGKNYYHARLFAHNAHFDMEFLWQFHRVVQGAFPEKSYYLPVERMPICTLQTALSFFDQNTQYQPPVNYKLGTLCEYFQLGFSTNMAHDALYDAKMTAKLYHALTRSARISEAA